MRDTIKVFWAHGKGKSNRRLPGGLAFWGGLDGGGWCDIRRLTFVRRATTWSLRGCWVRLGDQQYFWVRALMDGTERRYEWHYFPPGARCLMLRRCSIQLRLKTTSLCVRACVCDKIKTIFVYLSISPSLLIVDSSIHSLSPPFSYISTPNTSIPTAQAPASSPYSYSPSASPAPPPPPPPPHSPPPPHHHPTH